MLDIQLLRNDLDGVARRLATRGISASTGASSRRWRSARKDVQTRTQELQASATHFASRSARPKRKGEDASALMAEVGRASATSSRRLEQELERHPGSSSTDFCSSSRTSRTNRCRSGKSAEDNVEVRRVGEPRSFDFRGQGPRGRRRGAGHARFRRGDQDRRRALLADEGPLARLHRAHRAVHARRAYARARLHRGLCAVPGQCRQHARHGSACRSSRRTCSRCRARDAEKLYLIPTAEVPVTNIVRDEIVRARAAAAQVRLPLAVLPQRGRLLRQGHARHDPPAPVRQGGAGADRPSRAVLRRRWRS